MPYFIRTPDWLMRRFPVLRWRMPIQNEEPAVYLTFDDGPCPGVTDKILDMLSQTNAKATFFCVGANVAANPMLFDRIRGEGHAVGNHTQHHLNGWKTNTGRYISNVKEAQEYIGGRLFRPPYGRITPRQMRGIAADPLGLSIVMWSLLSGDFDPTLDPQRCASQVIQRLRPGDIVVFHDSVKAAPRVLHALPQVISHVQGLGWKFSPLP